MESQSQHYKATQTWPLYLTFPAFADASMAMQLRHQAGLGALWGRFSWWMSGRKVLRDLPDMTPPMGVGTMQPPVISPDCLILPTLLIYCTDSPPNIDPDDGMDFIKGYAAGCEIITPPAIPHQAARPLWAADVSHRALVVGEMTSIDDIEDPYCRDISVTSGNTLTASGNTDNLTWSVADLVAAASEVSPLHDGQIISCGMAVKSQNSRPLSGPAADTMCLTIDGLPSLYLG
ncbi:MAG: fumarylacetoacetate hydrolase family protein [Alphaproteobacteria bacterium]